MKLVQIICSNIVKEPKKNGFSVVDSFCSLSEDTGAKIGYVMEGYVNHWLSENPVLIKVRDNDSYRCRVLPECRSDVSISDELADFYLFNKDGSAKISFDGLYVCDGVSVPIEVKSGSLNGYLKHLDVVQESFYAMFGKGKFVHTVFIPFRRDTYEFVRPKLEKAVAKFPELAFIDISDFVYNVQLVEQELKGCHKRVKKPYHVEDSNRLIICQSNNGKKKKQKGIKSSTSPRHKKKKKLNKRRKLFA